MATIAPFRGLLFSTSRIPDLKPVVAPPDDAITPETAEELRSRHPHNIVHIDLPAGDARRKYAAAGALLQRWRDEGILVRDDSPAIYVTSQRYCARGMPEKVRWGFMALLRIGEEDAGVALPHERALTPESADRLELCAAARVHVSPVFALFSDPSEALSRPIEAMSQRPADRWVSDDLGVDTRLWRLTDREAIRSLCEGLRSHRIWIADGHHRHAAARELRDRLRALEPAAAPGSRSYDYVPAYFSNVEAPGLTILPYHRLLRGLKHFDVKSLERSAEPYFDVKHFAFEGFDHRAEQIRRRLREVGERGRVAVALYAGGAEFHLLLLKPGQESHGPLARLPEPLRTLDVSALHLGILETVLGIAPEPELLDQLLRYTEEAERAIDWVDAGEGQAAFLLGAPRRQQMIAAAEAGLEMPQKSTCFYPKVLAGLVLHALDPVEVVPQDPGRTAAVNARRSTES